MVRPQKIDREIVALLFEKNWSDKDIAKEVGSTTDYIRNLRSELGLKLSYKRMFEFLKYLVVEKRVYEYRLSELIFGDKKHETHVRNLYRTIALKGIPIKRRRDSEKGGDVYYEI